MHPFGHRKAHNLTSAEKIRKYLFARKNFSDSENRPCFTHVNSPGNKFSCRKVWWVTKKGLTLHSLSGTTHGPPPEATAEATAAKTKSKKIAEKFGCLKKWL